MTRSARRPDSAGVRLLVSTAAVAGTLVAWFSLAPVAHVAVSDVSDVSEADPAAAAPAMSGDPVEVPEIVDVTASASGRARGRR